MGRPTCLTSEVQTLLVRALTLGVTKKTACQYAGITPATLCNWANRAEEGESPYFELFEALEKAEAESVIRAMSQIENAAKEGTWQAAAWRLERTHPTEYGRQIVEQKHSGAVVHAHAWVERLQKAHDELDAKRVKQLPQASEAPNGTGDSPKSSD